MLAIAADSLFLLFCLSLSLFSTPVHHEIHFSSRTHQHHSNLCPFTQSFDCKQYNPENKWMRFQELTVVIVPFLRPCLCELWDWLQSLKAFLFRALGDWLSDQLACKTVTSDSSILRSLRSASAGFKETSRADSLILQKQEMFFYTFVFDGIYGVREHTLIGVTASLTAIFCSFSSRIKISYYIHGGLVYSGCAVRGRGEYLSLYHAAPVHRGDQAEQQCPTAFIRWGPFVLLSRLLINKWMTARAKKIICKLFTHIVWKI